MPTVDHKREVNAFIRGVQRGSIVAGRLVKLAVERHLADLKLACNRGFRFDESRANEAINFATICCHSKGEWAGQPLVLEPFQKFIVWVLFGWRRMSDGMRRFRRAFISMARKNGKSVLCSFLALLLFCFDNPVEAGAEIYVAATKQDQACIIHSEATSMVRQSPSLRKLIATNKNNLSIANGPSAGSFFRPLGSDSDKTDGLNPHGVFLDELHAWQERHRGLHEKLTSGGASRRQPLEVTITTAGDDKSTIWKEELDFAERCLESAITGDVVSDTFFAFVACIDKEDDPFEEANWPKANPCLDRSCKRSYLREMANDAQQDPTKRNKFLRYHCNVQVSSSEKAFPAELWALGRSAATNLDGKRCHGAFDLGRTNDFAAIAITVPFDTVDANGDACVRYELKQQSWTCEQTELPLHNEPYRSWIDAGLLRVSDGSDIDFDDVESTIVAWSKRFDVQTWAYDPTFAAQMAQRLLNLHGLKVFSFTQAAKYYNEPIRKFMAALRAGQINHGGDPCLGWQAGNLCIRRNPKDEWMPDKGESLGKIDAMVSVFMAFSECLFSQQSSPTFYDSNEVEFV